MKQINNSFLWTIHFFPTKKAGRVLFFLLLNTQLLPAQTDSTRSDSVRLVTALPVTDTALVVNKHSPYRATLLAAALPGSGQIYNRQLWKAPLVYGGAIAFAYFINEFNGIYVDYRDQLTALTAPGVTADQVKLQRVRTIVDTYRRYRDLNIILSGVLYALQIVDANVSAHLKDFDLSDNLSLKMQPTVIPAGGILFAGVKMQFRFK
jgi:Family of unknown function (DUF5683)